MSKACELANILSEIYDENFGNECEEPFAIGWEQLRTLAGDFLPKSLVRDLGEKLSEKGFVLVPLDDQLVVTTPFDLNCRHVPGRILNDCLNRLEEIVLDDEDEEADDNEVEDDD